MSRPRPYSRWLFPLGALVCAGLILAGLEFGLRLFGVAAFEPDPFVGFAGSHPFFVKAGRGPSARYQVNPRHQRFFNAVSFPARKPENSFRVFVAGGSTALGFPFYDTGSFARFLQIGLDLFEPNRRHEVINAGAFGYASYRVARVVEEVLNYEPDLIVVLTGHNEFLEKRVYGGREEVQPRLGELQSGLDHLRIYRLLRSAVQRLRRSDMMVLSEEVAWERYSRDPEQVARILDHFRYNLEKMTRQCREQGVPLLLLTVPANLKDFAPNQSRHGPGLLAERLNEWERHYRAGLDLLQVGDAAAAEEEFRRALALDADYAELHFRLGWSLLRQGRQEEAEREFWRAVRLDVWPVRVFPEMNAAVRQMAGRGVMVAEAEESFALAAPDRIPGRELFLDHCHPTLEGQARLAESVLAVLAENQRLSLPPTWREDYREASRRYVDSLGKGFLGEAYYRAAVEVGLNLGRAQEGLRLAGMAKQLSPEHPRLSALMLRLEQAAAASRRTPEGT